MKNTFGQNYSVTFSRQIWTRQDDWRQASMDTLNPGYSATTNEKTPILHLQRGSEELPWDAVWNRGLHG